MIKPLIDLCMIVFDIYNDFYIKVPPYFMIKENMQYFEE
jgi:hypothetical protein